MIVTAKFVFIHLPKTGGTFAQQMIMDSYKNLNFRDRVKRKIGLIYCNRLNLEKKHKNSVVKVGQHGEVSLIPKEHKSKDIISIFRNPLTRYISQYEFKWWQRFPEITNNYSYENHPDFPNISFKKHYFHYQKIIELLNGGKKTNMPIGYHTFQFIRYYFKNPDNVLNNITESYIENGEYLNDMHPIKFIFNESLNEDLYNILKYYNFSEYRISNIKNAKRIYPEGIGKESHDLKNYYDLEFLNEVYEKDYLLFKHFDNYNNEFNEFKSSL